MTHTVVLPDDCLLRLVRQEPTWYQIDPASVHNSCGVLNSIKDAERVRHNNLIYWKIETPDGYLLLEASSSK